MTIQELIATLQEMQKQCGSYQANVMVGIAEKGQIPSLKEIVQVKWEADPMSAWIEIIAE